MITKFSHNTNLKAIIKLFLLDTVFSITPVLYSFDNSLSIYFRILSFEVQVYTATTNISNIVSLCSNVIIPQTNPKILVNNLLKLLVIICY